MNGARAIMGLQDPSAISRTIVAVAAPWCSYNSVTAVTPILVNIKHILYPIIGHGVLIIICLAYLSAAELNSLTPYSGPDILRLQGAGVHLDVHVSCLREVGERSAQPLPCLGETLALQPIGNLPELLVPPGNLI